MHSLITWLKSKTKKWQNNENNKIVCCLYFICSKVIVDDMHFYTFININIVHTQKGIYHLMWHFPVERGSLCVTYVVKTLNIDMTQHDINTVLLINIIIYLISLYWPWKSVKFNLYEILINRYQSTCINASSVKFNLHKYFKIYWKLISVKLKE